MFAYGLQSAFFVDSTDYRLNMVNADEVNQRTISFSDLDEQGFLIRDVDGKLKHHFDQLCSFLARQDQQTYRSLLIIQYQGRRHTRALCGKIDKTHSCAELYKAIQFPTVVTTAASKPVPRTPVI